MIATLYAELVADARRQAPRECCGLLVHNREAGLLEVWPARNAAETIHEFMIDPRDQYSMLRAIGKSRGQLELDAIYHSHPRGPAGLSDTDRALAFYPVPLVVVSLEPIAVSWFPPS